MNKITSPFRRYAIVLRIHAHWRKKMINYKSMKHTTASIAPSSSNKSMSNENKTWRQIDMSRYNNKIRKRKD